ncbi:MAG: OmpH family outer membrane protein [Bacteroidetes bacterium]|nr:OmpH family outer membrane protein [Bacteroidota bacterium]MBL0098045.1 OmpH family outer membrane protein [Bacteroidota bacterium]
MKQASLILNVILFLAVAYLYYLKFNDGNTVETIPVSGPALNSKIVFVDSDSLMDNYTLFKDMLEAMGKKRDSLDKVLMNKGSYLEKEIKEYQERAAGMSAGERQLREESLMKKQQALMEERDNLLESLKEEEAQLTDSIHVDLMSYLKVFNKKHGYDFILGYSRGGGILLASDSLDITKQVVNGLNQK